MAKGWTYRGWCHRRKCHHKSLQSIHYRCKSQIEYSWCNHSIHIGCYSDYYMVRHPMVDIRLKSVIILKLKKKIPKKIFEIWKVAHRWRRRSIVQEYILPWRNRHRCNKQRQYSHHSHQHWQQQIVARLRSDGGGTWDGQDKGWYILHRMVSCLLKGNQLKYFLNTKQNPLIITHRFLRQNIDLACMIQSSSRRRRNTQNQYS